jgi:hypothetical protein
VVRRGFPAGDGVLSCCCYVFLRAVRDMDIRVRALVNALGVHERFEKSEYDGRS